MTKRSIFVCRLICVVAGLLFAGQALGATMFGLERELSGPRAGAGQGRLPRRRNRCGKSGDLACLDGDQAGPEDEGRTR